MNRTLSLTPLLGLMIFSACGVGDNKGVETGNGFAEVEMGLQSAAGEARFEGMDQGGTTFVIDRARTLVRRIELMSPVAGCDQCEDDKIKIEGPFLLDLVSRTSTPAIERVSVPAGDYKRVDVRLDFPQGNEPQAASLGDLSFTSAGSFDYDGRSYRFELALRFNAEAKFEGDQGIRIEEGEAQKVPLLLDPAKWFSALPLTDCLRDGLIDLSQDPVLLHEGSGRCSNLKPDFANAIRDSGRLQDR